ncbi:hypothetical protein ACWDQO_00740 [Streptomyces sp. NPDC003703]|uniref:hypothetical protein n=1 Tax=Streptomyces sp. NPDC003283 TaxID=3364681 RepID=UPI0036BDE8BC
MHGGGRYWNEETQRWENGRRDAPVATSPPPARPDHAPDVPAPGPVRDPDAPTGRWTVSGPPSAAAGSGVHGRRRLWTAAAAAAGTGVVALVVTLSLGGGSDDDQVASAADMSTPAADLSTPASWPEPSWSTDVSGGTVTGGQEPDPATRAATAEPPAGYAVRDDPEGFRIAVPDGWERRTVASQFGIDIVNYSSGSGRRRIQVYQVAEDSPDASFTLYLSDAVPKPSGFRALALDHVQTDGVSGTRLEYVADSLKGQPDIGTWHVYDERFAAADGKVYAIASYGPDSDSGGGALAALTTALGWFCPPGAVCPAPTG